MQSVYREKGMVAENMENMIEMNHVQKAYRKNVLFTDLNLTVPKGDICGIVGANGIGKSVLLKMLCGLVLPDSGEVVIDNVKLEKGRFPQNIGVILDNAGFLPNETGLKNLSIIAGVRKKISTGEIEDTMRLVGLDPSLKIRVGKYSLGMKQRLAIAQALMEKPSLLILDEPLNAIDIETVEKFRQLFKQLSEQDKITIILTSHHRDDILELCRTVYQIENGKLNPV